MQLPKEELHIVVLGATSKAEVRVLEASRTHLPQPFKSPKESNYWDVPSSELHSKLSTAFHRSSGACWSPASCICTWLDLLRGPPRLVSSPRRSPAVPPTSTPWRLPSPAASWRAPSSRRSRSAEHSACGKRPRNTICAAPGPNIHLEST